MAQNLTRYDVVDAGNGWELKTGGRVIFHFATKSEAIDHGRLQQILDQVSSGEGTVRIHTEIGGIEEERTYPRSKDPRKSPG